MNPADVSVIIPAYNNADTIGRALASVAAQTVPPRQVVVVDDGSADGTFAAAEACRGAMNGIELVLLRQANQGAGAARNAALGAAAGRLAAFLDADDEWLPDKLAHSLAYFDDPGVVFVSHDLRVTEVGGSECIFDCARHFRAAADPFLALMLRGFVATSTVVTRRDAVVAAGGFDAGLRAAQDYDLWLRLAQAGRFVVFAGALTRYHVNPAGITANVARRRECSLRVLERNLPGLAARRAWWVAGLRALIIQYEAVQAFRRQGRSGRALIEAARALPGALAALWRCARAAKPAQAASGNGRGQRLW